MSILNRAKQLFSKQEEKPSAPKKEPTLTNEDKSKILDPFVGDGFNLELDNKRMEYIKENATQVSAPRPTTPEGVAMDSSCAAMNYQGSFDYVNRHILSYYVASSSFIGYYAMAVIAQHWLVQVGCSSAAEDAMRHGYQLLKDNGDELEREEARRIAKLDKKYKLDQNIIEGDTFNNVFGIRHILFKHTDENFDYEKPFNADAFKGGKYAGISQIDPYWITPELDNNDISDPTAINYYEPTFWLINGKRYHKSHFVILTGEPVADYLKPTYRYGGISMAQKVYERVYAGERTANEIPQLAMTKRMNVRKTDLAKAQANKQAFINSLNAAAEFRDNYGTQVIGKDEESTQLETSLADLDKSMWANYHLVASIFRRPVSKIFGTGHGGFSTGETDEDYDIAMLESLQSGNLEDIAHAHYQRLMMSEFGKEMDLDIVWNPLKIMSDKDMADVNFVKSQTAMNEYNIGAIGDVDERERLSKDKYSGYSGVEVVEDVPPTDEEIAEAEAEAKEAMDAANNNGYVSVKPYEDDARHIVDHLESIGVNGFISQHEMHATLMYSKSSVINGSADTLATYEAFIDGEAEIIGKAPWRALVVKLDSDGLRERHEKLKSMGGKHSYDEFLPHISLKYDPTDEDLQKLKNNPLKGKIRFCNESFAPIKES